MSLLSRTKSDIVFDWVNNIILTIILLLVLYPLYFVAIASISDPVLVSGGEVWFVPRKVTFEGYGRVFNDPNIISGYKNSLVYAISGTSINLAMTLTAAYALSRKNLIGRNVISFFLAFTMFFSGGMIPTFLIVNNLGMVNKIWAMIIPNAVGVWNIIIARTFLQTSIPRELYESATIDGCSHTKFFTSIVLPLSKALIAILILFYGVGHWNSFFNALIYLRDTKLFPLQLVLRGILIQNQMELSMVKDQDLLAERQNIAEIIKYSLIIIASLPLLVLYPFLQKYFVKGVMIGSLKG